jgi:hypothetical protein
LPVAVLAISRVASGRSEPTDVTELAELK